MTKARLGTEPEVVLRRLQAMGVKARLMKGRRCVLGAIPVRPMPFRTQSGPLRIAQVVFVVVGADRIKCLRPRALFQLPMLRMIDCRDVAALEGRIRREWDRYMSQLDDTRRWLESIGAEIEPAEEGSVLTVNLQGEDPQAYVSLIDSRKAILPGRGPLSGLCLERPEDRLFPLDRSASSMIDLEIAISGRCDELSRLHLRQENERRQSAILSVEELDPLIEIPKKRTFSVMLVGPRLCEERSTIESLRLRGYHVTRARNGVEAMAAFENVSPELVIADMNLDRSEGTELVVALREITGVEDIPVVLVDEHRRASRRDAARQVGAVGYLGYPIDVAKIAKKLESLVVKPGRRRFTRYPRRVSVQLQSLRDPLLATALGRGGLFLAAGDDLATSTLHRLQLSLPELGETLVVDAEVLYRSRHTDLAQRGVGIRFHAFPDSNEKLLIEFLVQLEREKRI